MSVTQSESGPQLTARSSSVSGEGGIRTRGGVTPTQHFQCCTFGRSVTSPKITSPYLTVTCVFTFLLTFRELHSANFSANFR